MELFKHFLQYYKPYKTVFFLDLLCASIISIVDLAFPLILNFCTDNLFMQSHSKSSDCFYNKNGSRHFIYHSVFTRRSLC